MSCLDFRFISNTIPATGLGGAAGGVDWKTMGYGVKNYGCATISSDTGHNSTMSDASWAFNDEEARQDWGHRALHLSTELAKNIVNHYYDQTISHSYYAGKCLRICFSLLTVH